MQNIIFFSGVKAGMFVAVVTAPVFIVLIKVCQKFSKRIADPNELNVGAAVFVLNIGPIIYRLYGGTEGLVAFYGNMIGIIFVVVVIFPVCFRIYLRTRGKK